MTISSKSGQKSRISRAQRVMDPVRRGDLLSKSRDSTAANDATTADSGRDSTAPETRNDGRIEAAVAGLLARSLQRGERGRFIAGAAKTGEHAEAFWIDLAPVKAEIVANVRKQLAADDDDAPPTLLAVIDGFAEAHLLRKSTFMQLAQRGGPVTNKGRVRGLLQAWGQFFDREQRAAERLGLVRRARRTQSPAEWLESLDDNSGGNNHEDAPDDNDRATRCDPQ